jgi:hypothetical protein
MLNSLGMVRHHRPRVGVASRFDLHRVFHHGQYVHPFVALQGSLSDTERLGGNRNLDKYDF